jgi:hypothetical protein
MKASFHGLKVAISSTGYYVGRYIQEDEATIQFVRLVRLFNKKSYLSDSSVLQLLHPLVQPFT